jgi:hypothetical protein
MMEALHSTETSVLISAARRNIPEDGILCVLSLSSGKSVLIWLQLIELEEFLFFCSDTCGLALGLSTLSQSF